MPGFDDFQGTMHGAALLLLPVITGGLVFAFASRPERDRVMRALGVCLVVIVVFFLLGIYYSKAGWPKVQLVLLLACLWAGIFIGAPLINRAFAMGMFGVSILMLFWFAMMVVQGSYVGRRDWTDEKQRTLDVALGAIAGRLVEASRAEQYVYEPGWLAETHAHRIYQRELKGMGFDGIVERPHRLWHTWLTSLHARITVRREIWFPGGRVFEGAPKMEWRDRPEPRK